MERRCPVPAAPDPPAPQSESSAAPAIATRPRREGRQSQTSKPLSRDFRAPGPAPYETGRGARRTTVRDGDEAPSGAGEQADTLRPPRSGGTRRIGWRERRLPPRLGSQQQVVVPGQTRRGSGDRSAAAGEGRQSQTAEPLSRDARAPSPEPNETGRGARRTTVRDGDRAPSGAGAQTDATRPPRCDGASRSGWRERRLPPRLGSQ